MSTDNQQQPQPATLQDVCGTIRELACGIGTKLDLLASWRHRYRTGEFNNPRVVLDDAGIGSIDLQGLPPGLIQQHLGYAITEQTRDLAEDLRQINELSGIAFTSLTNVLEAERVAGTAGTPTSNPQPANYGPAPTA